MELLNTFFSASGKNNFYNSLASMKSSPMHSPRPLSNLDMELTFAKDLNYHPIEEENDMMMIS